MAEENVNSNKQEQEPFAPPPQRRLDAKWDACLDLGIRRVVYSTLIGGFAGLILFRTPVTRWASTTFGAGLGLGSAYSDCSRIFGGNPRKLTACVSEDAATKVGED